MKCRATAGNGLYTSDTIVEAPVRWNPFLLTFSYFEIFLAEAFRHKLASLEATLV